MNSEPRPVVARIKRPPPILICAKCRKRAPRGRAIEQGLKAALSAATDGRGKRAKLVRTACLGLCPKRAVAIASGTSLHRRQLLVVREEAEVPAALRLLVDPDGETPSGS